MSVQVGNVEIHEYMKQNPRFVIAYQNSVVTMEFVEKIKARLPDGHVTTVCEFWCGDCRRHVPQMARIADALPGWSFDVLPWDNATHAKPWQVRAIPTFVVFAGGQEIGRIIESPNHGSIEEDLWEIVEKM
jgi:hypothetical protein